MFPSSHTKKRIQYESHLEKISGVFKSIGKIYTQDERNVDNNITDRKYESRA